MAIMQNITPSDLNLSLIGLSTILLLLLYSYLRKTFQKDPRLIKFAQTLPGPPTVPLFGNSLDIYHGENTIKRLTEYFEKYGEIYRLWWGKHLVVGLSKIEDLEMVFMNSKMLGKPKMFHPFSEFWGDGLFTAPVPLWKKYRKRYQPIFGNNRMDLYTSIFNEKINNCLKIMSKLIDGPEFNAWDYLPHLSFDAITKTTLNMEFAWDDKLANEFHQSAGKAVDIGFTRLCLPWFHIKLISDLFYKNAMRKIRSDGEKLGRKVVEEKMDEINTEMREDRETPFKSLLRLAFELKEETNNEKLLYDEIIDTVSGGTNTVAMQVGFVLLALAIHQDVQAKVYDEIHELFCDVDRDADQNDIKRLPYLDQVIKESLRRFTLIPLLLREVEEDSKIGDRTFPAGTAIMVSIAGVHFNPKYYPNPWSFNPDNFNPEVVEKRPKFAYIPFSAGARNCIGQNYALLEMKLTIIALLRNFSLHTTMKIEDIKLNMGFVMNSVNGYRLSIKLRGNSSSQCK